MGTLRPTPWSREPVVEMLVLRCFRRGSLVLRTQRATPSECLTFLQQLTEPVALSTCVCSFQKPIYMIVSTVFQPWILPRSCLLRLLLSPSEPDILNSTNVAGVLHRLPVLGDLQRLEQTLRVLGSELPECKAAPRLKLPEHMEVFGVYFLRTHRSGRLVEPLCSPNYFGYRAPFSTKPAFAE